LRFRGQAALLPKTAPDTDPVARSAPSSPSPDRPAHADDLREGPSKTRRKHDMHALQDLGLALAQLDPGRLATLELPERLVDAITLLRKTTKHEARRRQVQYIGRLMRDIDPAPLREAMAVWEQGSDRERVRFAAVEGWRDRLLGEPEALDAFVATHAGAAREVLVGLIADVRAERARNAPPRKFRALFREIKRIVDTAQD
jgi:ribosome-associated protein